VNSRFFELYVIFSSIVLKHSKYTLFICSGLNHIILNAKTNYCMKTPTFACTLVNVYKEFKFVQTNNRNKYMHIVILAGKKDAI